jgi:hypothetical protein
VGLFDDWEQTHKKFMTGSGASFSDDRRYRYLLWRSGRRPVTWVLLNPSTADETTDDPTIRRCRGYARDWGYDGVIIANAFAWRSTNPKALYTLTDPVGPENDEYILRAASLAAGPIVCGWGNHGVLLSRGAKIVRMLRDAGHSPKAFGFTKHRQPWHPLYLKADLELQDML